MDVGWAYDLDRDGGTRTVSVVVAGGRLNAGDLPEESKRAISTTGRSAVDAILDREELPRYIVVTSSGLREEEG
jgi:hypothetical protein